MVEKHNEDLSAYTTVRIGGTAERMLIPESTEELLEVIRRYDPKYYLGGGSNLLINDRRFEMVVNLRHFDDSIRNIGHGQYRVGASAHLQNLIRQINQDGYGGIEYLYNVPGLVGGAIAMNAGTGIKTNRAISDYIVSVDLIREGQLITLSRENCGFSYRHSDFKGRNNIVIVSAVFEFPVMDLEDTTRAKKEKMEYYRNNQDPSFPNFGSVYQTYNHRIMQVVKKLKLGKRVHFSGKTLNWILNEGGTYADAIKAIKKVESIHKIFGKKCVREVVIWD